MTSYNKLTNLQEEVNEVTKIMIDNIDKTLKRDEKLNDIETKTEELQDGAKRFKKISTKLKQKLFCKNMKFILILSAVIVIFILIIVLITIKK
jgi:vesicle-associated membrane protein 4